MVEKILEIFILLLFLLIISIVAGILFECISGRTNVKTVNNIKMCSKH